MTANVVNQVAYLRTSRSFPIEIGQLTVEINKSYVDIANAVNSRTISIFPTNRPAITGESWFIVNQRQQTLRQVYPITSFTAFNHGIDFTNVATFTVIRGIGFDGTIYFPLPYVNAATPANSVGVSVNATQVVFTVGGAPPAIISGFILLEWLSQV